MKNFLEKVKDIKFGGDSNFAVLLWRKVHTLLFLLLMLGALGFGGYVWYQNVYIQQWPAEKRDAFIQEHDKSVVFREAGFRKVIGDMALRKERFAAPMEEIKNIFAAY